MYSSRKSNYRAPRTKVVGGPAPVGLLTLEEIDEQLKSGELSDAAVLQHPTLGAEQLRELATNCYFGALTRQQVDAELVRRAAVAANKRARVNAPPVPKPLPTRSSPSRDLSAMTRSDLQRFVAAGVLTADDSQAELERRALEERVEAFAELDRKAPLLAGAVDELDDGQVGVLLARGDLDYRTLPVATLLRRAIRCPDDQRARAEAERRGLGAVVR